MLHSEDGGRIRYQRVCAICGQEVTWDEIVKGYEYSKDHYVQFSPEELQALDVDSIKAIDIVNFIPLEDIDPIYYNKTYFVVETMHWPDEIRTPAFEELDRNVDVRDSEVKMARQLIQQLSSDFQPDEFHDEYREHLQTLVEQKVEGQEITVVAEPEEEPTKVVDLMDALKASVAKGKKRSPGNSPKKKPAAPRAPAS